MDGRKIVGWNVRKLRVALGFSIEELADRAGLGDSFVSKLERGQINASIDNLELLAKSLRADLADLLVKPKPGEKPPAPLRAGRRPQRQPAVQDAKQLSAREVRNIWLKVETALLNAWLPGVQKAFADGGSNNPRRDALLFIRRMPLLGPREIWEIDQLLEAGDQDRERPGTEAPKPPKRPPAMPSGWHRQLQLLRESLEQDRDRMSTDLGGGLKMGPGLDPVLSHSLFISDYGPTPENLQHLRAVDWVSPETAQAIDRLLSMDSQRPRRPAAKPSTPQARPPKHERGGRPRRNPKAITRGRLPH